MEEENRTRPCADDYRTRGVARTARNKTDRRREEAQWTLGVDNLACVGQCSTSCGGPCSTGPVGCLGQEKRRSEDGAGAGVFATVPSPPDTENRDAGHFAITSSTDIVEGWSVAECLSGLRIGYGYGSSSYVS